MKYKTGYGIYYKIGGVSMVLKNIRDGETIDGDIEELKEYIKRNGLLAMDVEIADDGRFSIRNNFWDIFFK